MMSAKLPVADRKLVVESDLEVVAGGKRISPSELPSVIGHVNSEIIMPSC